MEDLGVGVEERVQEAKRRLALGDELVVDEGDHAGEDGSRRARSSNRTELVLPVDVDILSNGSNIGEATRSPVEPASVDVADLIEVAGDGGFLP